MKGNRKSNKQTEKAKDFKKIRHQAFVERKKSEIKKK